MFFASEKCIPGTDAMFALSSMALFNNSVLSLFRNEPTEFEIDKRFSDIEIYVVICPTLYNLSCALGYDFVATMGVNTEKYGVKAKNMYAAALTSYLDERANFTQIQQCYQKVVEESNGTYLSKLYNLLHEIVDLYKIPQPAELYSAIEELRLNIVYLDESYQSAALKLLEASKGVTFETLDESMSSSFQLKLKELYDVIKVKFDSVDYLMKSMMRLQVRDASSQNQSPSKMWLLHELLLCDDLPKLIRNLIATVNDFVPQRFSEVKRGFDEYNNADPANSDYDLMQTFQRRIVRAKKTVVDFSSSSSSASIYPDEMSDELDESECVSASKKNRVGR